jgi:hypothetical protein
MDYFGDLSDEIGENMGSDLLNFLTFKLGNYLNICIFW